MIKKSMRKALYYLGVFSLYHRVRNRRALTVLMFHRVLPNDHQAVPFAEREFTISLSGFRRILDFVERHYNIVSLKDMALAKRNSTKLPTNSLLITFDDGWQDTIKFAMPELKARGLNALLFLTWNALEDHPERWWQDALVTALAKPLARASLCKSAKIDSSNSSERELLSLLSAWMAKLQHEQRYHVLETAWPGIWNIIEDRQMLCEQEVAAWLEAGFEIGSHGMSHVPLTYSQSAQNELNSSLQHLKAFIKDQPTSMSFPHGAFNERLLMMADEVGFDNLFSSEPLLQSWPPCGVTRIPIGRIHLPENQWTSEGGEIAAERLAMFLFFRSFRSNVKK